MSAAESIAGLAGLERGPRGSILRGAALLILGLAVVGVGGAEEGSAIALTGLLIVIYGIHRFGRLGPDELAADATPAAREALAIDAAWEGGLAALVGIVLIAAPHLTPPTPGTPPPVTPMLAYVALLAGGLRAFVGYNAMERARRAEAKAAEARSAEADAPAADAPPKPRRRRPRSKQTD